MEKDTIQNMVNNERKEGAKGLESSLHLVHATFTFLKTEQQIKNCNVVQKQKKVLQQIKYSYIISLNKNMLQTTPKHKKTSPLEWHKKP